MTYNKHMNKIILVDKPAGWTSFDVVARIRGEIRKKFSEKGNSNSQRLIANSRPTRIRVGHAGTLDPFATGLLIVLVGEATKVQDKFMKLDKEYEATLKLGYSSNTGDPEGVITKNEKPKTNDPARQQIEETLNQFLGEIEQTPPAFSAIKVNGERAYKLARAGKKVEIKSRRITINELEIINYEFPRLTIRVKCSSGTYIRTLAEDIGAALGCGAYLTELRRTKIGEYDIKGAETVESVIKAL
jgi:tRNA pseudouridine55 synthase